MLSNKYIDAAQGVTHARKNSAIDHETKSKQINSSRGSKPHISGQPIIKNVTDLGKAPKSARAGAPDMQLYQQPIIQKSIPKMRDQPRK